METLLKRYKIDSVWHFTDRSNIARILQHKGLLSLGELQRRGIAIPVPGGNQWSHDADKIKGVHEYVHLAFIDNHPMLYLAKKGSRIPDPVWIKIDSSILLNDDVRFTCDVSNKTGVELLSADEAKEGIDFEVLFTRMDWKNPAIKSRRQAAEKSEILIPKFIPLEKLLGKKDG